MILTTCAACAAPLAHNAPRCVTLQLTNAYARALADGGASLHDLREAVTTFEDIKETSNRVLGMDHPLSCEIQGNLERARKKLTGAEETSGSN